MTAARDGARADLAAAREAAAAAREAAGATAEGLASQQAAAASLSAQLQHQVHTIESCKIVDRKTLFRA